MAKRKSAPQGPLSAETICAHLGEDPSLYQGGAVPPIYQNSTFVFPDVETRAQNYSHSPESEMRAGGLSQNYDYSRVANPTTDIVEAKIAALEKAEDARCFGSGMGAISAAILSCVRAGDHVIAVKSIYGPTLQFLRDYLVRFDVTTTFVEGTDPVEFAEAVQPNTRLIYVESPSSVVFKQQDLQAVAEIAKAAGASTICDNSWASPIFQNPIEHGIDMVVHSATKYLGGHSDIVAGVVAGNKERLRALKFEEGCLLGAMLDPFASWLMLRGMRTLPIRMERFQKTTQQITRTLQEHPAVLKVLYPGLSDEPQPELTRKQLRGTTSLFSFALKNQTKEAAYQLVNSLELFGIGCSWGGFESLALPMSVSSRVLGENSDKTAWIVRCHLGLEGADELWDDFCHALTRISHLS